MWRMVKTVGVRQLRDLSALQLRARAHALAAGAAVLDVEPLDRPGARALSDLAADTDADRV
jgi:hypothetical protein